MNKKLLELFKVKCKDMGLSEAAIEAIVSGGSDGLTEASTDAEIEVKANLILPFAKAMQGEATRWAQTSKEKTELAAAEKAKAEKAATVGGEEKPWEAAINTLKTDYDTKLSTLEKENQAFKAEKAGTERATLISTLQKKHGLSDEHMKFVAVPADQDPDVYLTSYKQHLITQGLVPAVVGSAATAQQASEEAAKGLLAEIEVK